MRIRTFIVIICLLTLYLNSHSQELNDKVKFNKSETRLYRFDASNVKSTTSKISLGLGSDINLYKDQQPYLLLSADFTMLFSVFFVEANFDFIAGSKSLFSIIPGFYFNLFNSKTTVQLGCGVGVPIGFISVIPELKLEHEISKYIALGLELKSPLGSSHINKSMLI